MSSSEGFARLSRLIHDALVGVELTPLQGKLLLRYVESRIRLEEATMDTPQEIKDQPQMGPPAPVRPKGLTVGRNVHFVGPRDHRHYAALVTDVTHYEYGLVNLAVFAFGSRSVWWEGDVAYDPGVDGAGHRAGTWHYIEYAE